MVQKNSKIFSKETIQLVSTFCESQEIKDVDNFMYLCFKQGFDIKRYGLLGKTLNEGEKDLKTGGIEEKLVEIEVIREIRVEVPVEVIKEVEKVVTKIEYISDKSGENELLLKIQQLENEMSKKDLDLDELRQKLDIKEDNDKIKLLQETLQNLRGELQQKNQQITELEKINRELNSGNSKVSAILLRGSNLNNRL
jgi:DNA repair exonuclease SbcCD ATPase subunit